MKQIKDRADAVAYLLSQGVFAMERDWVLGETIAVAAEPDNGILSEHSSFNKALYIYPRSCYWPRNSQPSASPYSFWSIDDMRSPYVSSEHCVSLGKACDIALKIFDDWHVP